MDDLSKDYVLFKTRVKSSKLLLIKVGSKASIFTIYSVMQMARIKSIAESDCQLTT